MFFFARRIKEKSEIASISVTISIIVIFLAISISSGFKKEIYKVAVGFTGEILMVAPGQDVFNDLYPIHNDLSYLPEIENITGVTSISPVAYKPGMIKTDETAHGILCKGVDSLYPMNFFEKTLIAGRLPNFSGSTISNEILISRRMADILGFEVGDNIISYFIDDNARVRKFEIVGLYNAQLEEVDKTFALIDIRHVQRLNGWKKEDASCIEIRLEEDRKYLPILEKIQLIAMDEMDDEDTPVIIEDVSNVYPHLFDWLEILNINVLIILILMIIVAGFNMVSGLLIIIFKKISMIGLLKALGMKGRDIGLIFVTKAGIIISKGILIGNIVIGLFFLLQIKFKIIKLDPANYFVDSVPINISLLNFIIIDIAALIVMLIIMLIPLLFISKISPSKSLKIN